METILEINQTDYVYNETLDMCFDKDSRIEGVLECFEWIKNKNLIKDIK